MTTSSHANRHSLGNVPMKTRFSIILCAFAALFLVGCDSAQRTVDTTRRQLSEFQAAPDNAKLAAVEQSLAKLDRQIADLEKSGDKVQADIFRRQAASIRGDFQAARLAKTLNDAKNAFQGFGEAIKDAGKSFNATLQNASKGTNK